MGQDGRFEALVREHGPAVFGILVRFVRDRAAAEDLYQEVFLYMWKAFSRLDPDRDAGAYLRTIAIHRAIDHERRAAARPRHEVGVDLNLWPGRETKRRGDFEDEIAALPGREREAILLYYQAGLSVAEIGSAFGVAAGTVKSWLFRARARLKARLERGEPARKSR